MHIRPSFAKVIEPVQILPVAAPAIPPVGRAPGSVSGTLQLIPMLTAALLLVLAAPGCQVDAGAAGAGSTGAEGTCVLPEPPGPEASRIVPTACGACAAGCYAITSQISVCPDRAAPVATDCSADVMKVDNACACEGRTCAAGQQCYKELVASDGAEVHNVCGPDPQCLANTDCAKGEVCVPPFSIATGDPVVILTDPGGVCVTAECQVDADCTAAPCGACRLLVKQVSINSGRDALDGIRCIYGTATK